MFVAPRTRWTGPLAAVALVLVTGLSACSGEPEGTNAQAGAGPTAATAPDLPKGWTWVSGTDVAKIGKPAGQVLPATVTGDDGVSVTITDTSRTIGSGDDIIEVFDALGRGGDIFAAPRESKVRTERDVEHLYVFNRSTGAEGILSLKGSLFIGNSLRRQAALAVQLREAGVPTLLIEGNQPPAAKIRKIAAALGMAQAGEDLARQVEAQYAQAAEIAKRITRRPRVLHLSALGAGGRPATGGKGAPASAMIEQAGGIDIGTQLGVEGYGILSPEGVVQADPDVIMLTAADLVAFGGETGLLKNYPTLAQTRAIQARRVLVMPDLQLRSGGVATGAGVVALARAFAALDFT